MAHNYSVNRIPQNENDNHHYYDENDNYNDYDTYDTDDECIYDGDEVSNTKYNIILCELYNETIHGPSNNNAVNSGFLVSYRFKEFNIKNISCYLLYYYSQMHILVNNIIINNPNVLNHRTIRNYDKIYLQIKPEIAECHYLATGELIAIKKTIWIRLIQRTWKNIYKKRQEIFKKRCSVNELYYRELHGNWRNEIRVMPSINGMLRYLHKK